MCYTTQRTYDVYILLCFICFVRCFAVTKPN